MKRCIVVLLLAAILLAGCARETEEEETRARLFQGDSASPTLDVLLPASDGALNLDSPIYAMESDPERKLVQSAALQVETETFDTLRAEIKEEIQTASGYMKRESISRGEDGLRNAALEICVPVQQAEDFLAWLEEACDVTESLQKITDVTADNINVESAIPALETKRDHLLELLEQAETTADKVNIESNLADVNQQLASATAQLQLWESLVPYCTVNLQIQEIPSTARPTLWQRISGGFGKCLWFVGRFLEGVLVVVISGLPAWGFFALIYVLIRLVVWFKEKRERKKSQT